MAVGAAPLVGEREVLAVVDGEVQMVKRVVRGTVNDRLEGMASDHVRVVDLAERQRHEIGRARDRGKLTKILQKLTKMNRPR